jgi:Cu-Zn family superoxide dismutase
MNAVATFYPQINNGISGQVSFHECDPKTKYVKVNISLSGFMENQIHAIHIHEFGDLRKGCSSLGAHFNPDKTTHGSYLNPNRPRHAGDMINNIVSDNNGNVSIEYTDPMISLFDKKYNVIGRSVVIHKKSDDLGRGTGESLVTGNAGERIACAVIGIAEPKLCV